MRPLLVKITCCLLMTPALAGCGHLMANMKIRELVVQFQPGTTQAERLKVLDGCKGYANAVPEPVPTSTLLSVQLNDVRFRVDNASDADIAHIEACFAKFPRVTGVHDTSQDMR